MTLPAKCCTRTRTLFHRGQFKTSILSDTVQQEEVALDTWHLALVCRGTMRRPVWCRQPSFLAVRAVAGEGAAHGRGGGWPLQGGIRACPRRRGGRRRAAASRRRDRFACTLELPGRGRGRRGMASSQGGVEQAFWHQPPTGLWPSTGRLAVRTTR